MYVVDTSNNQIRQLTDLEKQVYAPLSASDGIIYVHTQKQEAIYAEALKLLMEEAPWLYLHYEDVHLAFKKGVKGYYITPDSGLYLWNAYVE